jgi:hypothetical protein
MRDDKDRDELKQLQDVFFAPYVRLRELTTELDLCGRRIKEAGQDLLKPDLPPPMLEHLGQHIQLLQQEFSGISEEIQREIHQLAIYHQGIERLLREMQPFLRVANPNPDDMARSLQSIGLLTTQSRAAEGAKKEEEKDSDLRKI